MLLGKLLFSCNRDRRSKPGGLEWAAPGEGSSLGVPCWRWKDLGDPVAVGMGKKQALLEISFWVR